MTPVRKLRPEPIGVAGAIAVGTILAAFLLGPFAAPARAIDCTCRFGGQNFELGATACLKGPNGPRLARCEMVLNNTSWRLLQEGCLLGKLPSDSAVEIVGS